MAGQEEQQRELVSRSSCLLKQETPYTLSHKRPMDCFYVCVRMHARTHTQVLWHICGVSSFLLVGVKT